MITDIEFENFTAFEKLHLSLSPRVNVRYARKLVTLDQAAA